MCYGTASNLTFAYTNEEILQINIAFFLFTDALTPGRSIFDDEIDVQYKSTSRQRTVCHGGRVNITNYFIPCAGILRSSSYRFPDLYGLSRDLDFARGLSIGSAKI